MKTLIVLLLLLTPTTLFAERSSKVIVLKNLGATLFVVQADGSKNWTANNVRTDKSAKKAGVLSVNGHRNRSSRWTGGSACYVDNEAGRRWSPTFDNSNEVYVFKDGSTITLERESISICEIDVPGTLLDYGTYENRFIITGGTGQYADASGTALGKGRYQQLWTNSYSSSSKYRGNIRIILD